ncbi:putative Beta-1,3-galactosyltransferase brn [Hypsibius exemplaris]|uniref:Hexosyltransferase n=1 Tax=Hypsibius exemplaris TaxID=2072580 RepID=A0A1W0WHY5_HYPEX|nr:putative Beta-1,3-galactosyltransferase brn [Hypsibius exemplaris]
MHQALASGEDVRRCSFHGLLLCGMSCFGICSCLVLVILVAVAVILPLFFTETIRHYTTYNLYYNPITLPEPLFNNTNFILDDVPLNPNNTKYTLEPRICSDDPIHHPYLVLFIPSRPGNAQDRAALRETWGAHARLCNVRVVFGFGTFDSEDLFEEVRAENNLYGDLLQTSRVTDAYHNQTRLVLSFLEWGANHCQGAKFIGKADEDTWINIFGVLKYLQLPAASENAVIGHFLYKQPVKRLPEEKWFLTLAEFPNTTHPPFPVGQLYVFPQLSLRSVLSAAQNLTIHWLDDVFIGGQIPEFLKMTLIHVKERAQLYEVDRRNCFSRKVFIIHATSADRKRKIFYDSCMAVYRMESCQAHVDLLTLD